MSISEAPANEVAIILMPPASVAGLDALRTVPFVHGVQLFAKTTFRHRRFNDVREVTLDCFCAGTVYRDIRPTYAIALCDAIADADL